MLTKLSLLNYRSHQNTEVLLKPLSLLIGPVGAGKSNIFKALILLQNLIHRTITECFPPGPQEFAFVRSRWAGETEPIGLEVELEQLSDFPGITARYTLRIADSPAGLWVLEETLQRRLGDAAWEWVFQRRPKRFQLGEFGHLDPYDPTVLNKVWRGATDLIRDAEAVRFSRSVAAALSKFGYFHLEVSELKSLGSGQHSDRIGYYGQRLPDFIAWTKADTAGAAVYDTILREMREVLPHLDSIIVTQHDMDRQGVAMSFKGQRGYVAAPDLSDGSMLTLGLLCMVHGPQRLRIVCIEEPETGLHPRRLRWVFDRFVALAYPRTGVEPVQVLLSTHSPYFVDLFGSMPDAVQVVDQREGKSQVTPLVDIQKRLRVENLDGSIGQEWAAGLFEGL